MALANFCFKIVPEIIVDRLAEIASTIISSNQNGFAKGPIVRLLIL